MHRIGLDNEEFEGRNNAYLLVDDDAAALIDTGIATPATRADLEAGVRDAGFTFADIDSIVLTHWHADHAGLAGEIQRQSKATVFVHEADAPLVAQDPDTLDAYETNQRQRFDTWGMPDDKRDELLAFFEATESARGEAPSVTPVTDGERLHVAGVDLVVRHAPGHTLGSCRFDIVGTSSAYIGDTVLPVYTPNIGGADIRVDRPLATYLATLADIVEAGYDRVWPGHRDAIDDPAGRAATIIEHHRERTERVIRTLREHGPADAWTVSAHLFGELHGIHIMHGPGEADAHLDHLADIGVIDRTDRRYHPPDPSVTIDAVVESHWPTAT